MYSYSVIVPNFCQFFTQRVMACLHRSPHPIPPHPILSEHILILLNILAAFKRLNS